MTVLMSVHDPKKAQAETLVVPGNGVIHTLLKVTDANGFEVTFFLPYSQAAHDAADAINAAIAVGKVKLEAAQ